MLLFTTPIEGEKKQMLGMSYEMESDEAIEFTLNLTGSNNAPIWCSCTHTHTHTHTHFLCKAPLWLTSWWWGAVDRPCGTPLLACACVCGLTSHSFLKITE